LVLKLAGEWYKSCSCDCGDRDADQKKGGAVLSKLRRLYYPLALSGVF
jgi:hypothetical protein